MKKKALKKLSKALRSGEFEQYRGSCYNFKTGGYCVLGVANSIFGGMSGKAQEGLYTLSPKTVDAVGFHDNMPYFLGIGLYALNDGRDSNICSKIGIDYLTFDELADLIDIAVIDGPKKYFGTKEKTT